MMKLLATSGLALGSACTSAAAIAGPSICIGTITEVELMQRVRQDAYFTHNAPLAKRLRIEYDGCGYRIHVDGDSRGSRGGDQLLVDRNGRVTGVVHSR